MESTSCGCNCPFVKQGFCSTEKECPNYIETWWALSSGENKLIKDCSPKRMILQQQFLQTRLESVQQALEQSRNEYAQLGAYLKTLVEASQQVLQSKLIQQQDEENEKTLGLIYGDNSD